MLPDDVPMLLPHGAKHSRALLEVRRRLREYLSEQAEKGQDVPMMRTARGLHPTVRWTIGFGEWLQRGIVFASMRVRAVCSGRVDDPVA